MNRVCCTCGVERPMTTAWFRRDRGNLSRACKSCESLRDRIRHARATPAVKVVPLHLLERDAILHAAGAMPAIDAAKALGIGRATLYRKLSIYGETGLWQRRRQERRAELERLLAERRRRREQRQERRDARRVAQETRLARAIKEAM